MNYTVAILGMAAVTFLAKASVFVLGDRIRFSPLVRDALDFVPVTALAAIAVPLMLAPDGGDLRLTWRNPHLVAGIAAIAIAAATRRQLLTIVLGLAVFVAWRLGVAG